MGLPCNLGPRFKVSNIELSVERHRGLPHIMYQSASEVPVPSRDWELELCLGGRLKMSSLRDRKYCNISPKVGLFWGSLQHLRMRDDKAGSASAGICSLALPHPTAPTTWQRQLYKLLEHTEVSRQTCNNMYLLHISNQKMFLKGYKVQISVQQQVVDHRRWFQGYHLCYFTTLSQIVPAIVFTYHGNTSLFCSIS